MTALLPPATPTPLCCRCHCHHSTAALPPLTALQLRLRLRLRLQQPAAAAAAAAELRRDCAAAATANTNAAALPLPGLRLRLTLPQRCRSCSRLLPPPLCAAAATRLAMIEAAEGSSRDAAEGRVETRRRQFILDVLILCVAVTSPSFL